MIVALICVLGLVIGSFLNVVVYRSHKGLCDIYGRSRCPHCEHSLVALDLVPVFSFIFLKGRCRYCEEPISWQYLLLELGTAMAFLLLYWRFSLSPAFFVYVYYTCVLIVIFMIDLRYYVILDKISIPAILMAFILSPLVLKMNFINMIEGVFIGGGFFLLQFMVSRGRWIGGGDLRMGVLMGAMLGWPFIVPALFLAYFIGAVISLSFLAAGNKEWKRQVPLGTFLSFATFLTFLSGDILFSYYRVFSDWRLL